MHVKLILLNVNLLSNVGLSVIIPHSNDMYCYALVNESPILSANGIRVEVDLK